MSKKVLEKKYYDFSMAIITVTLVAFGIFMVYSSSSYAAQLAKGDPSYYAMKQIQAALIGFAGMILLSVVDYHFWLKWFTVPVYLVSFVLCTYVDFAGVAINGQRRWMNIGSFSFQPSELAKVAIIMAITFAIIMLGKKIHEWSGILITAGITLLLAIPVLINSLSSAIILILIPFIMVFIVTKKKTPFEIIGGIGIVFVALGNFIKEPIANFFLKTGLLKEYQLTRILTWVDPAAHPLDNGYQVLQGLYAIGSGGISGKGFGESIQKLGVLPEAQNDMIFAVICEELGFIGAFSLLLLFGFLIFRLFVIANSAPDLSGSLLVIGVMAHISLQLIINIAVVCNLIPNTGVTLPFISYGGTSLIMMMGEVGLALSVAHRIRKE